MAEQAATFKAVFRESNDMAVSFQDDPVSVAVSFGEYTRIDYEHYDGPYEVTPTAETQTLDTEDKVLAQSVVINPIPSNYGLITWNGSVLTVS